MTKIFLVRHGQTSWNAKGLFQTHSNGRDNRLNKEGMLQVSSSAKVLANECIAHAFYSPLERSRQTLNAILRYHPHIVPSCDPRLTEVSLSFLDGLSQEDWEKRYPQLKTLFEERKRNKYRCELPLDINFDDFFELAKSIANENGEDNKVVPAWENYHMSEGRVRSFVSDLDSLTGNVLIVGHQAINRSILAALVDGFSDLDGNVVANMNIPNAVVYMIQGGRIFNSSKGQWEEGMVEQ